MLIQYCAEHDLIPLPRNIRSRNLKFRKVSKKVKVFSSLSEVRDLLAEANERTKLYLLLMLNCGMQQKDISDLQQGDVDWEHGRIRPEAKQNRASRRCPGSQLHSLGRDVQALAGLRKQRFRARASDWTE